MTLKAPSLFTFLFFFFFFCVLSILYAISAMAFGGLLFIYLKSTVTVLLCVTNFLWFRGLHMVSHTVKVLVGLPVIWLLDISIYK